VPSLDNVGDLSTLGGVGFEFEADSRHDDQLQATADTLRARLRVASSLLAELDINAVLPIQTERDEWTTLLRRLDVADIVVVLALLTDRSIATSIESTYIAAATNIPQVCVGIDSPVPVLLRELTNVVPIDPGDSDEFFATSFSETISPMWA
jgi:hypothetical protein